jgi:hypothetical protein
MPEMIAKFNTRLRCAIGPLAAAALLGAAQAEAATALACPAASRSGPLTGVELSDGQPSEQAFLAPDVSVTDKDGLTNRWTLSASPRGYWARCSYGRTVVDLKLPMTVRQCSIRYDKEQKVLRDGKQPACR